MGDLVAHFGLPFQYLANRTQPSFCVLAVVCGERPSFQSAERGELSLGISGWVLPPARVCHRLHLDGGIPALSVQLPGRNNPLHNLHVFDRRRFHQLVTDNTSFAIRAGPITFIRIQKMVGDLALSFLDRITPLFLGLREPTQSSPGMVVSWASDRGCRIHSPLFRKSFLPRDESASNPGLPERRRATPADALDRRFLCLEKTLRSHFARRGYALAHPGDGMCELCRPNHDWTRRSWSRPSQSSSLPSLRRDVADRFTSPGTSNLYPLGALSLHPWSMVGKRRAGRLHFASCIFHRSGLSRWPPLLADESATQRLSKNPRHFY